VKSFLVFAGVLCWLTSSGLCLGFSTDEQEPANAKIKISWSEVDRTGFVKTLLADPQFLQIDADLRLRHPKSSDLTLAQMKAILDVPSVSRNLPAFMNEAVLSQSNLNFNFDDDHLDNIMALILSRLGKQRQDAIATRFIQAITDDPLQNIHFQEMYSVFRLGAEGMEPLIQQIIKAKKLRDVHLTRELGAQDRPTDKAVVPGFSPFLAGQFGFEVDTEEGSKIFLVVQTEETVGHLQEIIPGKTVVNGYVAQSDKTHRERLFFRPADTLSLLKALTKHWGVPDKISDQPKKLLLSTVAAIYANGDVERLKGALNTIK
jgi:hypothetical protein